MVVLITIVMLIIWTALMMNIYSIFQPFIQNVWQIADYNQAYYGAIASIERSQLIIRMHDYGFEWSWWWIWNNTIWAESDWRFEDFGRLSYKNNWINRSIKSLSDSNFAPKPWNWNIDPELRRSIDDKWWVSKDYNKLDIWNSIEIALYKDGTSSDITKYYTWVKDTDLVRINPTDIFWQFRLPPYVMSWFGWTEKLAEDEDRDNDTILDDIIVNRMIFDRKDWFQIFSNTNVDYNLWEDNPLDTNIREEDINNWNNWNNWRNVFFSTNKNPTVNNSGQDPDYQNITPITHAYSWSNFKDIFTNAISLVPAPFIKMQFVLPNIQLLTKYNNVYPFIEYKLEFAWLPAWEKMPEEYYHITWTWKVWKYNISIKLDKKVNDKNSFSFSTITF